MGIVGLLVEVVGIGVYVVGRRGEQQSGNGFANAFVGHGDGTWMGVDLDCRAAGNLFGKATGNQIRRVDIVIAKRLDAHWLVDVENLVGFSFRHTPNPETSTFTSLLPPSSSERSEPIAGRY